MKLFKLSKAVLRIQKNPAQFLNGLTSNTLDSPRNAFLNIHGRIIAVFDQVKINEDEFWAVVEGPFVEVLLEHLQRYVKISNIEIMRLTKHVYFDLDSGMDATSKKAISILQKTGRLIISDDECEPTISEEDFTLFRLKNHIPVQGIDYKDEFVLNVNEGDIVSFEKGCFLGQEPVSKVHNRSSPTWKLVVKYENECEEKEKAKMTSKAPDPDSGRILGFVFDRNK